MVTVYDVEAGELINALKDELKKMENIKSPVWSSFVKTGIHKERVPSQPEFWYLRAASILRNLYVHGPKGVQRLRTKYGGRKNRGSRREKFVKGSGKILRTIIQQLEKEQLVKKIMKSGKKGRQLTPKAVKLMDNTAYKISKEAGK
ncbi:30S ribosomal protein S19e [archaeon CG07_land_8_20_14_0_80_38_8]|nr:MAG: 30S ribosomal protein S19e [archaeon CG07_land_8_20_14_0_80_38_8]